jgi:hypothetical protein
LKNREIESAVHFEEIGWEIKKLLLNAKDSIRICVAWIGWTVYKHTLEEAASRGVSIEVIYNSDEKNRFESDLTYPQIKFYPIRMPGRSRYMHNKFCVIDNEILITGSYNWSRAAELHFENIIVLKNAFKVIKEYINEFYELIDYHNEWYKQRVYLRCLTPHGGHNLLCRSHTYNIGLLGYESGRNSDSETEIWSLCNADNRHVEIERSIPENFLFVHLGLTSEDFEYENDEFLDKDLMLRQIDRERARGKRIFNYFEQSRGFRVQAIGFITEVEPTHKYDDGPHEKEIRIVWRNPYFRKIIPSIFYDDGTIDEILDRPR